MKNNPKIKNKDIKMIMNRRLFLRNSGILLAASGVSSSLRWNLLDDLSKALFPRAYAKDQTIKRLIFIGVRSGIPVIGIGTHPMFTKISSPIVPNCPYVGNELMDTGVNNLYLTSSSLSLQKHVDNLAITQGVRTEGGHTTLFNFWEGGLGAGLTSPIVELADRNPSQSVLPGVHFLNGAANRSRVVTHKINNQPDLETVHESTFKNNFKKPSLLMDENSVNKILSASVSLSRRQALRLKDTMDNSLDLANQQHRSAILMNLDYQEALSPVDMSASFFNGSGPYLNFGKSLALTLKAMSLNLINSSCIELSVGDWHGLRDTKLTRPYYEQLSEKLAAAADYLKQTPEPSDMNQTLWDTTLIIVGSEFTRVDRTFNQDNGDGGSQGLIFLGKNIKGGYYGDIQHSPSQQMSDQILKFSGVDRETGRPMPIGSLNTTSELYNTINYLIENSGVNMGRVLKSISRI